MNTCETCAHWKRDPGAKRFLRTSRFGDVGECLHPKCGGRDCDSGGCYTPNEANYYGCNGFVTWFDFGCNLHTPKE